MFFLVFQKKFFYRLSKKAYPQKDRLLSCVPEYSPGLFMLSPFVFSLDLTEMLDFFFRFVLLSSTFITALSFFDSQCVVSCDLLLYLPKIYYKCALPRIFTGLIFLSLMQIVCI